MTKQQQNNKAWAKRCAYQHHESSEANPKGPKSTRWPSFWKSLPFSKMAGIIFPPSVWNYPAHKHLTMPYFKDFLPSEMALTLSVKRDSLNKSTSYYHFISTFFYNKARTSHSLGTNRCFINFFSWLLGGGSNRIAYTAGNFWNVNFLPTNPPKLFFFYCNLKCWL